ncbi:MAG: glycosyltransferase family 4 protein [Lachnospiraceae bacterium]|nr:glycosyltransferase family 4 protein [Lachnospiraceae bacterium]
MKILIIRTMPNKVDLNAYNLQEIGLAKALVEKGHQCDVMYYNGKSRDRIEVIKFGDGKSINVIWKRGFGLYNEGIYPGLKKYVDKYDIVQVAEYVGIVSAWLNIFRKNKTVNYHGPYYYENNRGDILKAKVFDALLLPLSRKKNMVVMTKSKLATEYIKAKGIENVVTLGVGLDTEKINTTPVEDNDFLRKVKTEKSAYRYLLYVGEISERRNSLFLLELLKKISETRKVKLIVVGNGKSDYVDLWKNRIRDLELDNLILYSERLEQQYVGQLYKYADVFLLPTNYEIFGMVLLEAMYFGVPVFTTYNGGSSTLLNGDNGFIINSLNVDEWMKYICKVLDEPKKWNEVSKNARRTIEEGYTWNVLADKFLDVYNKRLKMIK